MLGTLVAILEKAQRVPQKVSDFDTRTTECWDETNAQMSGIIKRELGYPDLDQYEVIYSGPHFFVGTPLTKTPR
jgi:hypothetical protein